MELGLDRAWERLLTWDHFQRCYEMNVVICASWTCNEHAEWCYVNAGASRVVAAQRTRSSDRGAAPLAVNMRMRNETQPGALRKRQGGCHGAGGGGHGLVTPGTDAHGGKPPG